MIDKILYFFDKITAMYILMMIPVAIVGSAIWFWLTL